MKTTVRRFWRSGYESYYTSVGESEAAIILNQLRVVGRYRLSMDWGGEER